MKKILILMAVPLALACAQSGKKLPPSVPVGATEVEPYLYQYTDGQGVKWFYRQTPFGVQKWQDKPAAAAPLPAADSGPAVTDLGDSVRFEWQTPFGTQTQIRKKSDLTGDEKAIVERQANKGPAPESKAVLTPWRKATAADSKETPAKDAAGSAAKPAEKQ